MAMDGDRLAMIDSVGVEAILGMWPLPARRGLWQCQTPHLRQHTVSRSRACLL